MTNFEKQLLKILDEEKIKSVEANYGNSGNSITFNIGNDDNQKSDEIITMYNASAEFKLEVLKRIRN